MYIERNGNKYELTEKELSDANTEFVTNWMRRTLEEDFDMPEEFSQDYAEWAYERYCEGNGETEYECVRLAYEEYLDNKEDNPDSFKFTEEKWETLKRELFMQGWEALEDFLGDVISDDKDVIDNMLDQIADQMPDEELYKFYDKYCN